MSRLVSMTFTVLCWKVILFDPQIVLVDYKKIVNIIIQFCQKWNIKLNIFSRRIHFPHVWTNQSKFSKSKLTSQSLLYTAWPWEMDNNENDPSGVDCESMIKDSHIYFSIFAILVNIPSNLCNYCDQTLFIYDVYVC